MQASEYISQPFETGELTIIRHYKAFIKHLELLISEDEERPLVLCVCACVGDRRVWPPKPALRA